MPGPINNNPPNNVDPYNNQDEWLNSDLDGTSNDGGWGEGDVNGSQYTGMDDGSGGGGSGLSVADTVQSLTDAAAQLKEQLKDNTLSGKQRQQILGQYNEAKSLISKLSHKNVTEVPAELERKINDILLTATPTEAENTSDGGGEEGGGDLQSQITQTKTKIDELKGKINASDLSSTQKSDSISKLDRALSALDISQTEEQLSQANEAIVEVNGEFEAFIAQPKCARDLASKLNKPIEDVISAAEEVGLNLEHLPDANSSDMDKVMKFLEKLEVVDSSKFAEFGQAKETRKNNLKALKDSLVAETDKWRAESEDPPSTDAFSRSFAYWNKTDDDYKKIENITKGMRASVVEGLNALGYSAQAGEKADQVVVNGTNLDFLNEDAGTFSLSTTLNSLSQSPEDFAPAPKNTEASSNEGHDYDWFEKHDPEGYPEVTFTID